MVRLLLRGDDLPLVHGVRVRVHGVRVVRDSFGPLVHDLPLVHGPPGGSFGPLHGLGFMILGMGMDGEVDDFRGSTAALEWRRGLGWVGEEELGRANKAAGGDKQGVILSGFRPDLPPSRRGCRWG